MCVYLALNPACSSAIILKQYHTFSFGVLVHKPPALVGLGACVNLFLRADVEAFNSWCLYLKSCTRAIDTVILKNTRGIRLFAPMLDALNINTQNSQMGRQV